MSKKTTETKKARGSNKMRRRALCNPHNSAEYRKGLAIWQFINKAKKITPPQKGALIYMGYPLSRESDNEG